MTLKKTIAVCASGPSLVRGDCEALICADIPVIAVNSTWQLVPECRYIYAADRRWWQKNVAHLPAGPQRWTCNKSASAEFNLNYFEPDYRGSFNSGLRAILFARYCGASNIILLGFDCSIASGSHWHGNHTDLGNPNQNAVKIWQRDFIWLSGFLADSVKVINCSRKSTLTCFTRAPLSEALVNRG